MDRPDEPRLGHVAAAVADRARSRMLACPEVAPALEALLLEAEGSELDRAWSAPERQRLHQARCCYGHLAGRLGVRLFDTLRAHEGLAPAGPAGRSC